MLIDTHAHVNFIDFKDDGEEVIKRALAENVQLINVGSQSDTSRRAVEMAQEYPRGVWAAVGLHPSHLRWGEEKIYIDEKETIKFKTLEEDFDYVLYKKLAQNPKVVAIGETGLDYYRIKNNELGIKEKQKELFKKQIELAMELKLPLIIHCRDAHKEVLEILKQYCHPESRIRNSVSVWDKLREGSPARLAEAMAKRANAGRHKVEDSSPVAQNDSKIKGVIHSFSGRWSQAEQYMAMGFYLGFNGIITFARDYDRVVKEMPLERLLLETDCPYLTPIPHRGKRNEPSYVKYVAAKVAELRGISMEEVAEATTANARKLFGI